MLCLDSGEDDDLLFRELFFHMLGGNLNLWVFCFCQWRPYFSSFCGSVNFLFAFLDLQEG